MDVRYEPGKAWAVCSGLALFMLLNFADKVVIGMTAVPIMGELHLTPVDFGIVAGSFFWLFPLTGIFGGFLANRFQVHWLLVIMALGWTLAQLPIIFGTTLAMVVVSRVVLGFFEGPAWGISVHGLYKWFPDDKRVLPVTILNFGPYISFLIAGLAMPWVNAHWGWRANFEILAVLTFLWGVGWMIFGREGRIGVKPASSVRADAGGRPTRVSYFRLLLDPTILSVVLMQFFAYFTLTLMFSWLPAFLEKGLGYSAGHAGRMFSLVVLIGLPLGYLFAWGSQKLTTTGATSRVARGLYMSGFVAVGGVLLCAVWLVPGLSNLAKIILLALGWVMSGVMFSVSPAVIGEVTPFSQRAALLTIYQGVATLSGIVAPIVMGVFVQKALGADNPALGYEQGFGVTGLLLIVSAVLGLIWANPAASRHRLA